MTYGFHCPSCKKWVYGYTKSSLSQEDKGKHLRVKHGWCELCEMDIKRDLICILKHKCKKDKQSCLLRYESPQVALNKHIKKDKHRWRKDIVIKENPEYYEPHMQDIDRQCVKCGWNVNICEPHYKGSYSVEQQGVNKLVYHTPPVKPKFEDHYDVKPIKADYKPGGKYFPELGINELSTNTDIIQEKYGVPEYKADLEDYNSDVKEFEETELEEWKDAMGMHISNRIQQYCGVNYYHSWCKNEQ